MDLADMTRDIRREVALGCLPYATIVEETATVFDVGPGETDLVRQVVTAQFRDHLAAQAGWPAVTDNDRLTAAFRRLASAGVVPREFLPPWLTIPDLKAEMARTQPSGTVGGYVFYREGDARQACDEGGLMIYHGRFDRMLSAEVGAAVADALAADGLPADWTGEVFSTVPMTWRVRRVGRSAAFHTPVDDDVPVHLDLSDPWTGEYAPRPGPVPASVLAQLYLPWLPADTRVRVTVDGVTVVVRRRSHTLVGERADTGRSLVVGRHHGMDLVRWLRDGQVTPSQVEPEPGLLEVTYDHPTGHTAKPVPLDLAESVELIRGLPPYFDGFVVFVTPDDQCVQIHGKDSRLWLESPDPVARRIIGRLVDVAEAERMVTILATEGRVAVDELGDLQVETWGSG